MLDEKEDPAKPFRWAAELTEKRKQHLLSMFEISIWLDTYEDIFSDFDPRQYNERSLSVDFLEEAKRASRDKPSGNLQLKFVMPAKMKNPYHEAQIKKRLQEHFKRHHMLLHKEASNTFKKGMIFTVIGIVVMFLASFILFKAEQKTLLVDFLVILLEPAGWFLFWEGLNIIVFKSKEISPELEFYRKMAHCEIRFYYY